MAATVNELKEMIIDLRVDLVKARIPETNCPYAYYNMDMENIDCNEISCNECKRIFLENMREKIKEEVMSL